MTQKNWPLLIAVARQIIAHPETWDQRAYVSECGTAFCFAGHAALMSGCTLYLDVLETTPRKKVYDPYYMQFPEELRENLKLSGYCEIAPGVLDAPLIAAVALGLGINEAQELFAFYNGLDEILALLDVWAYRDGIDLPEDLKSAETAALMAKVTEEIDA